ncbi:TPA: fimbrial protein [Citrobacter freundii]
MLNFFIKIILILIYSGYIYAEEIVVNFNDVSVAPDQTISDTEPFYSQLITLPKVCNDYTECQRTTMDYSLGAPTINNVPGAPGVSITGPNLIRINGTPFSASYKFENSGGLHKPTVYTKINMIISLLKTSNVNAGITNISQPLFSFNVRRVDSQGMVVYSNSYHYVLKGRIEAPACVINTKDLNFTLPAVTSSNFLDTPLGGILNTASSSNTLNAVCSSVQKVKFTFYSSVISSEGNSLIAKNENGEDSGLGFIFLYKDEFGSKQPIYWGNRNPAGIEIYNPSKISIPITAFYIKRSNHYKPGNLRASGTFVISYE